MFIKEKDLKKLRCDYPKGTRIVLLEMFQDDTPGCLKEPHPIAPGTRGAVYHIDDAGQLHMKWDNGRTLSLIFDKDKFRKLTEEELRAERVEAFSKFEARINEIIKDADSLSIHISPDFQCDQTGGFPTSLVVCWEKGLCWLQLNEFIAARAFEHEVEKARHMCMDWGIRSCPNVDAFNFYLHELGYDALCNAEIVED